ncbi:hypothetical protein FOPG_07333 [Fusarium oxysporum f. sp. conglutinans race 2 54008]|uniref:Uncharacterized protein n=2 Tax=Fusarium oxysporum TaxID=5507 RepID=X0MN27_FUSOX|nr:hypothetical protein FOPG_07333 [Fusarium oxysporum f. sp. conglutinans race 2 54008]EXM35032.1 hypothetical protein FOTG_01628 [Fusarium oxysporum f. sp. vasinfectum 25433]
MVGGATGSLERLAESSVRQATPKGDVNEEVSVHVDSVVTAQAQAFGAG